MKTNYLQAMGIVSWRLRESIQPARDMRYFSLIDKAGQCWATLIAEAASPTEQELLRAIFQAIGMRVKEGKEPSPLCIILGSHLSAHHPTSIEQTIITSSLKEMLNNPVLKSQFWLSVNATLKVRPVHHTISEVV